MTRRLHLVLGLLLSAGGFASHAAAQDGREITVASPSGKVRLVLSIAGSQNRLQFAVEHNGKSILEPSSLNVRLAELGSLAEDASVQNVSERTIDQSSDLLWGKSSRLRDHCREVTVRLRSKSGIEWDVELRAYDDGVALRYGFPEQQRLRELVIEDETPNSAWQATPTSSL
jgi:alpha-glucosidase